MLLNLFDDISIETQSAGYIWILWLASLLLFANPAAAQVASYDLSSGIDFYRQGQYQKAIKTLRSALNQDSTNSQAYLFLAYSYLKTKDYKKLVKIASRGLKHNPDHIRLMMLKAEGYYHIDYEKSFDIYRQVKKKIGEAPAHQIDGIRLEQVDAALGRLYQRKANDFYEKGRLEKSISNYRKARSFSPDSLSIQNNLAYTLIKAKKWKQAIDVLESASRRFPLNKSLLLMKGQAYRKTKQYDKMTEAYHQLYKMDPTNVDYGLTYGQALLISNQAQKANTFLHHLIKEHPDNKRIYQALKRMDTQRYNFKAKRNILKIQRQNFPDDKKIALELAQTNILLKKYEKARQIYDSLATATKLPVYRLQSARTWLYSKDKNLEKAASVYQSLVEKYPDDIQILIESALVLRKAGNIKRAQQLYQRSFEQGKDPRAAFALMEIFNQQHDTTQVLHYASKLKDTEYAGIGLLYQLKYGSVKFDSDEAVEKTEQAVELMLRRFKSVKQQVVHHAKRIKKGDYFSKPSVLQSQQELSHIGQYIDQWYTYLATNFSYQKANSVLDDALSVFPSSSKLYFFEGKLAIQHEDITKGIHSLKRAVGLGAKNANVQILLGDAYDQQGKARSAVLSYEQALTFDQKNEEAYRKLVAVSQKYGKLNTLCERWLKRYRNNKENGVLREYLIEALQKADRFQEANKIIKNT